MKKYFLTICTLCLGTFGFGQNVFKKNNIYLEVGGNGLFGSVNYERQLTKEPKFGLHVGIGFYTEKAFYLTYPAGISYFFKLKRENSFIDAGLGYTWTQIQETFNRNVTYSERDNFGNFIPSVGYRRHYEQQGLMWRLSITPIINKYGFVPWIGASVGKRF